MLKRLGAHWQVLVILVVAAFLRFWQLGTVPPSPSLDEVSLGYNAFSLLKTGADEYGNRFPLLLRAYDDWRPALYVYTVIPFVWLLGLTTVAVRLPSVLVSIGTVFATFAIGNLLFPSKKYSISIRNYTFGAGFFASLLLAISPWHIYISRLGHEVNLGLTFVVLGMYFVFRSVSAEKDRHHVIPGVVFLVLSMYSYQSQKIVVPVLVAGVVFLFVQFFKKHTMLLVKAGITVLVLCIPLIVISVQPDSLIRLRGTSAFTPENPLYKEDLMQFTRAKEAGNVLGQVFYNRRITPAKIFFMNYVSHANPVWLMSGGAKENHKVPYTGLMYPWEALVVGMGVWMLFSRMKDKRVIGILALWLLSAPLPAAITTQAPHAMRIFTAIPVIQLLGGLGIIAVGTLKKPLLIALPFLIVLSVAGFGFNYFYVFPRTHSLSFQYSLARALEFLSERQDRYNTVVVSNQGALFQSYMFYLFYSRFDPVRYQELGGTISGGFDKEHTIGTIQFRRVRADEQFMQGFLYIVNPSEVPSFSLPLQTFNELDGMPAVVAAETL